MKRSNNTDKAKHQMTRRRRRYLKRLPKIKATQQRLARKRQREREEHKWEWEMYKLQQLRDS